MEAVLLRKRPRPNWGIVRDFLAGFLAGPRQSRARGGQERDRAAAVCSVMS